MRGMGLIRRYILPYLMVLLVVMTGQAAAVAHAAPGPSGQVELCTGSGPVMVYLDADGQPMGDPVYCPDFALSLILALDLAEAGPVPISLALRGATHVAAAEGLWTVALVVYPARGPPVLI